MLLLFTDADQENDSLGNAKLAQHLSSEDVLKLSTVINGSISDFNAVHNCILFIIFFQLVDISRRLDDYSNNPYLDSLESAEIAALRVFVNVSS